MALAAVLVAQLAITREAVNHRTLPTEEVPREKVLTIGSIMEPSVDASQLSELRVAQDAIIQTVAEAILTEPKKVAVVDGQGAVVGSIHASKIISMLFGASPVAVGVA